VIHSLRTPEGEAHVRRLMIFFALVYVAEGAGQTDGLILQPLNNYLKQVFQWTPVQVTAYLTVFNLPWFIKPLYGAVSDFIPLFGYRRKTYLILANALAAAAYFLTALLTTPGSLVFFLLLTAYGMAISSTLCGAVLVENGRKFRASATFVNQQWLWFNIAWMAASLIGGLLVERLSPASAVHGAAVLVGVLPIAVILGTLAFVREEKSPLSRAAMRTTFASLTLAFQTKELWVIGLFLLFYYFSPGFSTPLYFYMTDSLKFSQQYIGVLSSIAAAGSIAGGLIYRAFLQQLSSKALLNLSIALSVLATSSFLLLSNGATAAVANFCNGVASMIMLVVTLSLAAEYCPKHSEGFAFAALIAVTNIATSLADNVGSFLYEHAFNNRLYPLVIVSAAFTALTFLLVPLLRLGNKAQGEPVIGQSAEWVDEAHPAPARPRQ
jgi:MFS family permease